MPSRPRESFFQIFELYRITESGMEIVPDCVGPGASPDPCISSRGVLKNGTLQITVLTTAASAWVLARVKKVPALSPIHGVALAALLAVSGGVALRLTRGPIAPRAGAPPVGG